LGEINPEQENALLGTKVACSSFSLTIYKQGKSHKTARSIAIAPIYEQQLVIFVDSQSQRRTFVRLGNSQF
jgi:hypothetical protein